MQADKLHSTSVWLEAPIFDIRLMVTCPGLINFRLQRRLSTAPEDRYRGRIAYLQRCLHQRGLVATEMVATRQMSQKKLVPRRRPERARIERKEADLSQTPAIDAVWRRQRLLACRRGGGLGGPRRKRYQ